VFEGVDRCGKSTQTTKLVDGLNSKGRDAVLMRFPNRESNTGKIINDYLTNKKNVDDKEIHKLFSDNRWEQEKIIYETLNAGKTVVADRYAYSGVAFTSAKGIDMEWCKQPDSGLPAPDAVIYLRISVEDAMKRGQFGAERYENAPFQTKVADIFHKLQDDSWKILDATKLVPELEIEIFNFVETLIEQSKGKPIAKLWVDKKGCDNFTNAK